MLLRTVTITVRVKIIQTPIERELDGLKLDGFTAGLVVDVTPALALWLIVKDYAVVEMRQTAPEDAHAPVSSHVSDDRRRS